MSAYYQLLSRTVLESGAVSAQYKATLHAQGAWNPNEQHMAPATGILCAELEQFAAKDNMRIARISLDIFGLIVLGEFEIITQVVRAGKTIELIESTMQAQGKTLIVARSWRMMTQDSSDIAGLEHSVIKAPGDMPLFHELKLWDGQFIQTIEARTDGVHQGKGTVWLNTQTEMIEGQETSDFVHLMGLVDLANGLVPRQERPIKWGFPNLDLQIHLLRTPVGRWLGLEVMQQYGSDGIGLTSAVLHDEQGAFGHSEQILTLRPLS